jgi:hypothetical protein
MGRQPSRPASKSIWTVPAGLLVVGVAGMVEVGAAAVVGAAAGRSVADGASWELDRLNIELITTAAVSTMATAARIHSAT